jgi:hypothetical protein
MAIGTVALVVGAVAAVVGAGAAIKSGIDQNKAAKAQSAILRQKADRERLEAAQREEDFRRRQSRILAARRAGLAAQGVEPGEGSPLLTSEDFAGETELQALRIRSGGEVTSTRLEQNANLVLQRGRGSQQAGFARGGSLLLSGAGRAIAA